VLRFDRHGLSEVIDEKARPRQRRKRMNLKLLSSVAFAATLGFAGAAYADITIGVIAPLTGPVAAYGDQVKKGAETAVEVINAKGGIKGEVC
jgi:branched-chain amino acid transport system substrate-binding protein